MNKFLTTLAILVALVGTPALAATSTAPGSTVSHGPVAQGGAVSFGDR